MVVTVRWEWSGHTPTSGVSGAIINGAVNCNDIICFESCLCLRAKSVLRAGRHPATKPQLLNRALVAAVNAAAAKPLIPDNGTVHLYVCFPADGAIIASAGASAASLVAAPAALVDDGVR